MYMYIPQHLNIFIHFQGRYKNGRLEGCPLNEIFSVVTINNLGLGANPSDHCFPFNAVTGKDQELINKEVTVTYIDNQQKVYKFKYYLYIMLYYNKIEIPVHTAHNILHTQIYT